MTDSLENLLKTTDLSALFKLNPRSLYPRELVDHLLKLSGAFFVHPGTHHPKIEHPILRSGKHSNAFCNVGMAMRYEWLRQMLGNQIAWNIPATGRLDWVVSSGNSGAPLAYAVAQALQHHYPMIKVAFCDKDTNETGAEIQVWKRFGIEEQERVLHVEELMSTGGAAEAVRHGIQKAHDYPITFLSILPVIVDRSTPAREKLGYSFIKSVTRFEGAEQYEPDACPFCAAGSKAVRVKAGFELIATKAARIRD